MMRWATDFFMTRADLMTCDGIITRLSSSAWAVWAHADDLRGERDRPARMIAQPVDRLCLSVEWSVQRCRWGC